jgi:transcriptional regulator GlxA family with amidase domain
MKDALARLARQRTVEVGILLFPDVEVLDFAGPFEVFSVAARLAAAEFGHAPFRVSTIAAQSPVAARHGLSVLASADFTSHLQPDILIVPGGMVTDAMADAALIAWIAAQSKSAALTASVCTGAFLLAKSSLLEGKTVTTHWEDIADLRASFPGLTVVTDVPYVDEGAIVTSAGIAAGIEMSLHLVAEILGDAVANRTARQMQYAWVAS